MAGYSLRYAIESILRERWINILAIFSTGVGLFLISIAFLVSYNLDLIAHRLPDKFTMVVFLNEDVTADDVHSILSEMKYMEMIRTTRFISKEAALDRLKKNVKDAQYLLEGLEENPLVDSIEIKLKADYVKPQYINEIISKIRSIKGVNDIEYGEGVVNTILMMSNTARISGIFFVVILTAGIVFNSYTTVKILFYRRNEEVETFKLLGASRAFIRIPFLIEGAIIGFSGGIISCIILGIGSRIFDEFSSRISLLKSLFIVPSETFLIPPVAGMVFGVIGALFAIGRIRY